MKLNPDCVRDIMLNLEENLIIDKDGDIEQLTVEEICSFKQLSSYQSNEIIHIIKILYDSSMLKPGKKYISDTCNRVADITPQGYEFIDSIKSKNKWNKLKSYTKPLGELTIKALFDLAVSNI
ncbi:DUF2513 domain-containing protein [Clostridium botulinum]|nr:DUF2513 domain-containing protein [Clostridium botulinum]